ncbi:hypothetical protein BDN71DRAFT_1441023 [Pleurotus eryngii]|uniref:F-box domain-containing protein n=1 Tax=Pleurotus eryngii TaxID=5323 RepID=A0A9P6A6J5_PLEER|nr:hypothetical protein BDN71DRAFT_1441023 [Pleurotus eryngii]
MCHTVTVYTNTVLRRLSFLHFQAIHLCQYIRVLFFDGTAAETIVSKAEWFPACFARLTNLHKLRLMFCVGGPLPAASLAAFAAPPLRKLYIQGWEFAGVYDLLSLLPPTLEELRLEVKFDRSPDNVVKRGLELKAPRIPGKRLDALRSLEIISNIESIYTTPHLIECPNLARLVVSCWPERKQRYLPPWLPASLPELVLSGGPGSVIPHFGSALRPALLTLSMGSMRRDPHRTPPYLEFFTWARDFIDRLPDPRAIRALKISINTKYNHIPPEGIYPALSDYEMFSRFLCRLRDGGSRLQSITLRIKLSARTLTASDTPDGVEARELAKLEEGFARLVEDNVLDADLTLLIPNQGPEGSAPLMHCSIWRRV